VDCLLDRTGQHVDRVYSLLDRLILSSPSLMHSIEYTVYSIEQKTCRSSILFTRSTKSYCDALDRVYSLLDRTENMSIEYTVYSIDQFFLVDLQRPRSRINITRSRHSSPRSNKHASRSRHSSSRSRQKLSKTSRSRHSSSRSRQTHSGKTVSYYEIKLKQFRGLCSDTTCWKISIPTIEIVGL
jgi:hypothetical protein